MMSPYDKQVYDAGFKYVPRSEFLLNPFQIPQGGGADASKPDFGLPTLNVGGGGGGGAAYTGGITGLTTDFQKAIDARTQRLEDAYNNPSTAKIFGMPAFRQDVNPADAGFYVAEDMRIPQQRTMLGKMFQPQSPQEIMEQGYTPRTDIGILSNILGKFDKFGTLPRADQAFITSQMGYTGPTVFGDNQSGLSKDPYGINTRSLFGNYADYVDDFVSKYEDMEEEDFDKLSDFRKTKIGFYRQKQKELQQIREQKAKEEAAAAAAQEAAQRSAIDRMFQEGRGGRGQDFTGGRFDRAGSRAEYDRDPTGFSGSSKDGGIIGYGGTSGTPLYQQFMNGGLADLVDIYD